MSSPPFIIDISADKKSAYILRDYLKTHHVLDLCNVVANDDDPNMRDAITLRACKQEKLYDKPVRLGALLDQILSYKHQDAQHKGNILSFGRASLDIYRNIFVCEAGTEVYLTEKEVAILSHLHVHKGAVVSRDQLLNAVWAYAETVETHTLETHIYRLRQKIEKDPARPRLLITEARGYKVPS